MSMNTRRPISIMLILLTLFCCMAIVSPVAYAKAGGQTVIGKYYEFLEKTNYTFSDSNSVTATAGSPVGELSASGDYTFSDNKFVVNNGTLTLSYSFDQAKFSDDVSEWHFAKDSGKKIDSVDLDEAIKTGAVILQTSLDGEKWVDDLILTNVFTENTILSDPIYITKDVQQQNGCYYRIIVAYELERVTGTHKVTFVDVEDKETKRVAEVYEFYAIDKDTGKTSSAMDTPRREMGTKVETDKDKGFSGTVTIDRDDPHYGWNIGVFTINGYTRETKDDKGVPVFLKNVGDKVVLWFTLKQDIECLNNNSALSIADDNGAYDQYFEIARTNFGRGTLIIRYTDYQGVKHDPIIYTNYLEANTRTGADTKVQLFEEGDYDVSLDYEIRNNPRQIGPASVFPTYTDYKITFSFSIRNGNCMVFPFDTKTNAELADRAITKNGFRLDMAKSRYLTIDVERQTIKVNADGTISTDTRFNRPAKDNDTYSDEGIYTFTVKNLYTGSEPTTKTIYVGSNKYLSALSNNGLTIAELNAKILDGYSVDDNGVLTEPIIPETDPPEEIMTEPEKTETEVPAQTAESASPSTQVVANDAPAVNILAESEATATVTAPENINDYVKSPSYAVPIAIAAVVIVAGAFYLVKMKKPKVSVVSKEENID